jgi:hypothetical protein
MDTLSRGFTLNTCLLRGTISAFVTAMRFRYLFPMFIILICRAQCWAQSSAVDLARVLRDKQIITATEFERIVAAGSDGVAELTAMLCDKGVITAVEAAHLSPTATPAVAATRPPRQPEPDGESGRKLNFYGTLLFNAYFNNAGSNNVDIPGFALPKTSGAQENFGATARQTRLGLSYSGFTAGGANVSGVVEADFFGGEPALTNGINMDVIRMRLAYGRLDWKHFAIEAGQDWTIFAPLNPTSIAEFAIPEFSASGNLWIRTPQIRTEWKRPLGDRRTFLWQMAALDPDIGDNTAAYSTAREPKAGELGRLPAVETRLALSTPIGSRTATVGMSGHWGAAKNTGRIGGLPVSRSFESWGVAADYILPLSRFVSITGEAYAGRALGVYSGGVSQTVLPLGEPGANGVGTRGGWLQVQLNFTKRWQSNTAYGIDAPVLGNLITASRSKNQSYMSNIAYHVSPNLTFAVEWRRFLTNYLNQAATNNIGDHFNLAAAYTF